MFRSKYISVHLVVKVLLFTTQMSLQDPWNILVMIISIARMKYIFYNFKTSSRVVRVQQLNNKNTQQYFTLKVVLGVILAPLFFYLYLSSTDLLKPQRFRQFLKSRYFDRIKDKPKECKINGVRMVTMQRLPTSFSYRYL